MTNIVTYLTLITINHLVLFYIKTSNQKGLIIAQMISAV